MLPKWNYEEVKIQRVSPFLVQDVLFNALLYQAEYDLAEFAYILREDPFIFAKQYVMK